MRRVRPHRCRAIRLHVGHRGERRNRRVLDVRLLVRRRDRLGGRGHCGFDLCGVPRAPARGTIRLDGVPERAAAAQTVPRRPFRLTRDGPCGAHGFPLVGRDDGNQISLCHDLSRGKPLLVNRPGRNKRRPERRRTHHAGVQHPGEPEIGNPLGLGCDLLGDVSARERLADHRVLGDRFHGRVASHLNAVVIDDRRLLIVHAGQSARDWNRQIELLTANEIRIGDCFRIAADHGSDDAVAHRERRGRHTQSCPREAEERLVRIRSYFAQALRAPHVVGRPASVGGPIRVGHHQRDRLGPDTQLFCHHLRKIGAHAHAHLGFASPRDDGAVSANLQP